MRSSNNNDNKDNDDNLQTSTTFEEALPPPSEILSSLSLSSTNGCDFTILLPVDIHHYIYDSFLNVRDRASYRSISPFLRSLLRQQQPQQSPNTNKTVVSASPVVSDAVCCSHRAILWKETKETKEQNLDYRYLIDHHGWFCDSHFVLAESVLAAANNTNNHDDGNEEEEEDDEGGCRYGKLYKASCRECGMLDIAIHHIILCTDYCSFNYKEHDTFAAFTKALLDRITGWCPHTDIAVIQQQKQQQVTQLSSSSNLKKKKSTVTEIPLQYAISCLQCGLRVGEVRHRAPYNGPYLYYWRYNLEWMKDSGWFESNVDLIQQQIKPRSNASKLHPMFCAKDATKCASCAWNMNNYAHI
mmetsp:Transcript_8156/g.11752  ORF Transcript_8156/g.11752 Transcript_8156/m.11752 type:complete len:357 (+) Transcript_8156:180-1250(+)